MGVWIETVLNAAKFARNAASHPSWVCGLKLVLVGDKSRRWAVTPFVGVWIETANIMASACSTVSHPSWVCGLKLPSVLDRYMQLCVTPFVGVWIETCIWSTAKHLIHVTPFVGVWIETVGGKALGYSTGCHTLRGCVD